MTRLMEHVGLSPRSEGVLKIAPRYNIAPTQQVFAVRHLSDGGGREPVLLRWGLIPSWAKEASIGSRMINARGKTVHEKPSFRAAFKRRRCLVAADGYYEWQKRDHGPKQPYFYHRPDDAPFAFAALWERWKNPQQPGETIESCTIITTDANEMAAEVHDRMPVVLTEEAYDLWLNPDVQDAKKLGRLLVPAAEDLLVANPVSTFVNKPINDNPKCVEAL